MTLRRRWGRLLRMTGIVLFVFFAGLFAFVQVEQHILRWRAERLLEDIREIQMGKSTWVDAQRFMKRWGEWGAHEGLCTAERCDYYVLLQDAASSEPIYFWSTGGMRFAPRKCCQWFHRPFRTLGGRQALIYGGIKVRNGIIWTKAYDVATGLNPRHYEGDKDYGENLIGSADGVTRFWENRSWLSMRPQNNFLIRHTEYSAEIAGICSGCRAIGAYFTPFADPAIVQQLFDFNLDCITRLFECETPAEMMPSAVRLYQQDKAIPLRSEASQDICRLPLEVIGRDYKYAAIAEVISTRTTHEMDGSYRWIKYRPISSLKNNAVLQGHEVIGDTYLGPIDGELPHGGRVADFVPGTKLILLSGHSFDDRKGYIGPDECGVAENSEQNFAAIQRGIQRDTLADEP